MRNLLYCLFPFLSKRKPIPSTWKEFLSIQRAEEKSGIPAMLTANSDLANKERRKLPKSRKHEKEKNYTIKKKEIIKTTKQTNVLYKKFSVELAKNQI